LRPDRAAQAVCVDSVHDGIHDQHIVRFGASFSDGLSGCRRLGYVVSFEYQRCSQFAAHTRVTARHQDAASVH
jgi:hypothetical protein